MATSAQALRHRDLLVEDPDVDAEACLRLVLFRTGPGEHPRWRAHLNVEAFLCVGNHRASKHFSAAVLGSET